MQKIFDNINRATNAKTWTLEEFRKSVETEITLLRAAEAANSDKCDSSSLDLEYSAASLSVTSGKNFAIEKPVTKPVVRKIFCSLCFSNEHYPSNCAKFQSSESRVARAKELRLCFNCLSNSHRVSLCKSKRNCRVCDRKHHTALCSSKNTKSACNLAISDEIDDQENKTSMTITSSTTKFTGNVLPTAEITVNSNGFKTMALFDTGSQKTFIVKSLVNELNLNVIGNISLALDGFGSKGGSTNYDVVELPIYCNNEII